MRIMCLQALFPDSSPKIKRKSSQPQVSYLCLNSGLRADRKKVVRSALWNGQKET